MKSSLIALLLFLLLPAMTDVSAQTRPAKQSFSKSGSFKSGFSSQRASSTSSKRGAPAAGGFGSFGGARPSAPQQSDSVLSQRLNKGAAEANALRTLEARRAANEPQYRRVSPPQDGPAPPPTRANWPQSAPIVLHERSSGVGDAITGFLLGRATAPSRTYHHGNQGQRNGANNNANNAAVASTGFGSFLGTLLRIFAWLVIGAVVAWTAYFIWKFLRRGNAPSNANYSFER